MRLKTPNSDREYLNIRSRVFSMPELFYRKWEAACGFFLCCFMEILRVTTSSGKKVPLPPFFSPLCFTFLSPPPPRPGLFGVPSPHVSGNNNNIRHCFHSMLFCDDVASQLWCCSVVMLTLKVRGSSQISKSTAFKDESVTNNWVFLQPCSENLA